MSINATILPFDAEPAFGEIAVGWFTDNAARGNASHFTLLRPDEHARRAGFMEGVALVIADKAATARYILTYVRVDEDGNIESVTELSEGEEKALFEELSFFTEFHFHTASALHTRPSIHTLISDHVQQVDVGITRALENAALALVISRVAHAATKAGFSDIEPSNQSSTEIRRYSLRIDISDTLTDEQRADAETDTYITIDVSQNLTTEDGWPDDAQPLVSIYHGDARGYDNVEGMVASDDIWASVFAAAEDANLSDELIALITARAVAVKGAGSATLAA